MLAVLKIGCRSAIGFWIFAVAVLCYSFIGRNAAQTTTTAQPGAGDALQMILDGFQLQINVLFDRTTVLARNLTALSTTVAMVKATADGAAAAAAAAQAAIDDEITPALENVTMTAGKLVNINKTWKSNFKVVNQTFMILKKKLSFRAPHIPLS